MSGVGEIERVTQHEVVEFFRETLRYDYLGHRQDRGDNSHIEQELLRDWLGRRGVDEKLISRTLAQSMMQRLSTGRVRLL